MLPLTHLVPSTPDSTVLLFTGGVALGALELNRPGLILPGAAGLTCVLLALAALPHLPIQPAGAPPALAGLVLLAAGFLRTLPRSLLLISAALYTVGLCILFSPAANPPLHYAVSLPCGIVLGVGLTLLATVARRARRSKGLD
jgi:membrane-bound serine protease (ClpP class)